MLDHDLMGMNAQNRHCAKCRHFDRQELRGLVHWYVVTKAASIQLAYAIHAQALHKHGAVRIGSVHADAEFC